MINSFLFLIFFLILYITFYFFIKSRSVEFKLSEKINLAILLLAICTAIITIYSVDSWKQQYYLTKKEDLIGEVFKQVNITNESIKQYQMAMSDAILSPENYPRELLNQGFQHSNEEIAKLLFLLKKSSKSIELNCTSKQLDALNSFERVQSLEFVSFILIQNTLDPEYEELSYGTPKLSNNNLNKEKVKVEAIHQQLLTEWRNLNLFIQESFGEWTGNKILEKDVTNSKKCSIPSLDNLSKLSF